MNLKTIYNKFIKDTHAVSPIVATLILIVVAIIGAAAVGVITGTFVDDVGDVSPDVEAVRGTIIISGNTTVGLLVREIAKGFMDANPSINVIVQAQENSDTIGIRSVGMGVIDMAMTSRNLTAAEIEEFPTLKVYQIGSAGVVVIGGRAVTQGEVEEGMTQARLWSVFVNDTPPSSISNGILFRENNIGIEEVFARYMIGNATSEDLRRRVTNIVFVDNEIDFLNELNITDRLGVASIELAERHVGRHPHFNITDKPEQYPHLRMVRPLNLITRGEPGAFERVFIEYARTPAAIRYFRRVGFRSMIA